MNLTIEETQLFFKLRFALLAYVNRHLKVIPGLATAKQIGWQPVGQTAKVRDALLAHLDLLERFVAENPEGFSDQELAILASWRHHITGDFYIIRYLKPYTVFMGTGKARHLYGVLGLIDSLEKVTGGAPLPIMVTATL